MKKVFLVLLMFSFVFFIGCRKDDHVHKKSDWIVEKEATCFANGLKYRECIICGERMAELQIESRHSIDQWELIKEPTDNVDGVEKGYCDVCGNDITRSIRFSECNGTAGLLYKLNEDGKSYSAVDYVGEDAEIIIGKYYNNLAVTRLDDGIFANNNKLTTIIIPEGIKHIGGGTFINCNNLSNVVIPEGLISIGESAFYSCGNLTEITLPESLTDIGSRAFEECYNIKTIRIPKNVSEMGNFLFDKCIGLENIIVDEDNANYKSIDGNIYSKDGKTFIQYAIGKEETKFVIPNGVTKIRAGAFSDGYNLTEVIIPDTVTTIDMWAFSFCTKLTKIIIPKSVEYVGTRAFESCYAVTFYCEAESFPLNWSHDWNWHNCNVVWGYKE